jgi:hypothetical protein
LHNEVRSLFGFLHRIPRTKKISNQPPTEPLWTRSKRGLTAPR